MAAKEYYLVIILIRDVSMIKVNKIEKFYDSFKALHNISFQVESGEIVGFLGPNGAGKTSTMKILTGYIPPTSGEASINGLDVEQNSLDVRRQIGYLPESNPLYMDLTVEEFLKYVCQIRQLAGDKAQSAIERVVKDCGLKDVFYKQIDMLSKGYRQRVGLAQALIHDPSVLILDEPTVGLDPRQIIEIRDLIKKIGKNKTVLLITHLMQEVQALCDRVIIINKGKVVAQGSPATLQQEVAKERYTIIYLKVEGAMKKVEPLIKKIEGVKDIEKVDQEKRGLYGYKIKVESGFDVRKKIIKELYKNDLDIVELSPKTVSMEDVFLELTKGK